jgi:hypothetical protein
MKLLITASLLILLTACRKDGCDLRCLFVGNYTFKKHTWSTCNSCPPEANTDTTYYFTGYVALKGSDQLEVNPIGTYHFVEESQSLRPGPPPYYGTENPKGYFIGDSVVIISSYNNYWGHQSGWSVKGTRIN